MKTEFFNSIHCASRLHCRTCRDREGGRPWRKNISIAFANADTGLESDFDCPHGLPWGFQGSVKAADTNNLKYGLSNFKFEISNSRRLAARRIAEHCQTCEHFRDRRCGKYRGGHCTPCEFAAYLSRPNAICPAGKFFELVPAMQGNIREQ